MDKGPGSAASLHSAGSRGGMFHSFCLPSHRLRSLVLRRERRLEPPQQIARIRVFPMRRQRVLSVGSPTLFETVPERASRNASTCQRERSILRIDKSAAARAQRREQLQQALLYGFLCTYITYDRRQASFETRRHGSHVSVVDSFTSPLERGITAGLQAINSAYLLRRQRSQAKKAPLTCSR
jgi:hypothetical protein